MNPPDLITWITFSGVASKIFASSATHDYLYFPQVLFDYDGSGNLIYVGIAPRGALTSASIWIIWNLTYSGTNLVSQKTSLPKVKWDNRATETYA